MKSDDSNKAAFIVAIIAIILAIFSIGIDVLVGWDQLLKRLPWLPDLPWRTILWCFILGIVIILLALRFKTLKTLFLVLRGHALEKSSRGLLIRLALGLIAGAIVLGAIPSLSILILIRWMVAASAAMVTWLGLHLVISSIRLRQLEAQGRVLPERYPAPQHMVWQYKLADILGSSSGVPGISVWMNTLEKTFAGIVSCQGIKRKAIYQHPPTDGKTDSVINFDVQIPNHIRLLVLTFYTGIMDIRIKEDGKIIKNTFDPGKENKVRFEIHIDAHPVFEEVRNTFEWRFHTLVLPAPENPKIDMDFRTNALGQPNGNWAVWGEPCLEGLTAVFADLARLRKMLQALLERDWIVAARVRRLEVAAHLEDGIDTGLALQPGQLFRIYASGEVSINWGETWIGPDGLVTRDPNPDKIGKPVLADNTYFNTKGDRGPDGTLLGWIGEDRITSSFRAGYECTKIADREGSLHLGVNDTRGAFHDNYADHDHTPTVFTVFVEILPFGEEA